MIFPPFFLYFFQGFKCGVCYYQGQQQRGANGAPQGFVRWEWDGGAGYYIGEFVDGKRHGHVVSYGSAGNVVWEADYLRDVYQR